MKWNQLTPDKLDKLRTHRDMFLVKDRRSKALFDLVFWYPVENMWMDRLSGKCCCERMEMFNDKEFLERFSHYLIIKPISYGTVEELFKFIKAHVSLLEVAKDYTDLEFDDNKIYHMGRCPFVSCNSKKKTFTVSRQKEIFYCFECSSGGDVISLVAQMEKMSPMNAAGAIADKYNLSLPEELSDVLEQC